MYPYSQVGSNYLLYPYELENIVISDPKPSASFKYSVIAAHEAPPPYMTATQLIELPEVHPAELAQAEHHYDECAQRETNYTQLQPTTQEDNYNQLQSNDPNNTELQHGRDSHICNKVN